MAASVPPSHSLHRIPGAQPGEHTAGDPAGGQEIQRRSICVGIRGRVQPVVPASRFVGPSVSGHTGQLESGPAAVQRQTVLRAGDRFYSRHCRTAAATAGEIISSSGAQGHPPGVRSRATRPIGKRRAVFRAGDTIVDTPTIIALIISILALCGIAFLLIERYKTRSLRSRFGPEFDRTVAEQGSTHRARVLLEKRQKRVSKYQLRDLTREERESLMAEWSAVQQRFVDDPSDAIHRADALVAK